MDERGLETIQQLSAGDVIAFIVIALFPLALSVFWFFHRWKSERRSLWTGIAFLVLVVCVLAFVDLMAFFAAFVARLESPLFFLIAMLNVLIVIALFSMPFVLLSVLFVTGIKLVRREGLRPTNLLSLGLSVVVVASMMLWPAVRAAAPCWFVLDWLFGIIAFVVAFTSFLFFLYVLTSTLNQLPLKRSYDYIVVLGAGLLGGSRISPLLEGRILKGMAARRTSFGAKLIMSGGQGADEDLPEGRAMRQWAVDHGVPEDAVLAEEASKNTEQNLRFSWKVMEADGGMDNGVPQVLVVSDNYHVYRALLVAKHMGLACDGRGAHVKLYFALNALVREFVAFLVIWRRRYLCAVAVAAVLLAVVPPVVDWLISP